MVLKPNHHKFSIYMKNVLTTNSQVKLLLEQSIFIQTSKNGASTLPYVTDPKNPAAYITPVSTLTFKDKSTVCTLYSEYIHGNTNIIDFMQSHIVSHIYPILKYPITTYIFKFPTRYTSHTATFQHHETNLVHMTSEIKDLQGNFSGTLQQYDLYDLFPSVREITGYRHDKLHPTASTTMEIFENVSVPDTPITKSKFDDYLRHLITGLYHYGNPVHPRFVPKPQSNMEPSPDHNK